MSQYARRRRMTDKCTVWSISSQTKYGTTWSTPRVISCNFYNDTQVRRDNQGSEFIPSAAFRFFNDPRISKGDRIVRGDFSSQSSPTSEAQTVRQVITKTQLRGGQAFSVYTG